MNEPQLAEAIHRLRGEWAERTGGELSVSSQSWAEVATQESIDADVILFPSRYLGELCTRDWLRPVRSNVWDSDELQSTDFFPLVRQELIEWAGQPMALPLGLEAAALADNAARPDALRLLAIAAPQAASKERIGILFDTETMKPRIEERPFVDALAQLTHADAGAAQDASFERAGIPLLGYADPLMSVSASSRNAASAFKLLEWLATPETSSQLARAAGNMLPVRQSLISNSAWFDPEAPAERRAEIADRLNTQLTGSEPLLIPRIPAIDEYLAALEGAIKAARGKSDSPQAALEQAAQHWEAITEAHGREAQREAYLKHLGIAGS